MNEEFFEWNWAGHTTLHPMGLAAVVVLGLLMLALPRRLAFAPIVVLCCFVAAAQRIVLADLDFSLLRIMVICGVTRCIVRRETAGLRLMTLDVVMVAWAISATVAYTALMGSSSALISQLGDKSEALGLYAFCRCMIRDWSDLRAATWPFVLVSIPLAIAFVIENATGRNAFFIFGGVPEFTIERDGRLRCQGAFAHPIIAGCFWASMMPVIAALWWHTLHHRIAAVVGIVGAGVIVITCASSTPIMAVLNGLVGAAFFPLRARMRAMRWAVAVSLLALHMVMMKPVWHLVARIDVISGSTGYYRYILIDEAINHIDEWWLCGLRSTAHWKAEAWDITNQYVLEGVTGGIWTLALFVSMLVLAFRGVGRIWRAQDSRSERIFAWSLGVALFVHSMNFIGVSYFSQIYLVWYMLLGTIASIECGVLAVAQSQTDIHSGDVAQLRPVTV